MEPFLQNHQYNRIAQQAKVLLSALQTSSDRKVIEAARYSALHKAIEACPGISGVQLELVERMANPKSTEELQAYLAELADYTWKFPVLTVSKVKGLFPKIKKLRMPDLTALEGRCLTYLGWIDPAANRLLIVYPSRQPAHELTGIEGRFVTTNKKGVCAFCNRTGEMALFTVVAKHKIAQLPDYYKAVGQYICLDSSGCNERITELEALERLIEAVK
jgi:hypothetical protein